MTVGRNRPAVPERVRWALQLLDPRPDDHLLEIGSGPGVAAALVCERLGTGSLLAIDRSPVATRRTAERNAAHVGAGRLEVRTTELDVLEVADGRFDAAFAVDVNLFWVRSPARELGVLRAALRRGGALHLCYGTGPQTAARITTPIVDALGAQGFVDVTVRQGAGGLAVSARTTAAPPRPVPASGP